ncbi:MAG: hypothetical protein ACI97A_000378 [Planctomycetota bacterium]
MFVGFFEDLRAEGIPVSLREFLVFLEALDAELDQCQVDRFYLLARICLVKHVKHYDCFDRVFARRFRDLAATSKRVRQEIPKEWLEQLSELLLSAEELKKIQEAGSLEEILEELKKRLAEQKKKHQGGSKWIGTGGTSRFGHGGFNPSGVRIGGPGRHNRAVKVWEQRRYRDLDGERELNTRNFKMALRTLRHLTREGREEEFDIEGTVNSTARNAGFLETRFRPIRKNRVRVLMLLDIGGSMDPHVKLCEELFSAAKSEIEHLETFYFHNCIYENVWRRNPRSSKDLLSTEELLRTYGRHYRLIVVGDASMSPYELIQPGGSIEHWNEQAGEYWLAKIFAHFNKTIWLNPNREDDWGYTTSVRMIRELIDDQMYSLRLDSLKRALKDLMRKV